MKKIHFSLISGIAVVLAVAGLGFGNMYTDEPSQDVTYPEPPRYEHTLKNDYGSVVAEDQISERTTIKVAKFSDISQAKLGEKQLSLLDVRMRDNGYVHYLYGADQVLADETTTDEFFDQGGVLVRTLPLRNQENTNDALANFLKDEVTTINGITAIVKGNDDVGYTIELYPGDSRKITVGAVATLDDLTQFIVDLGIENKGIDLSAYVKENWSAPEEPTIDSEGIQQEP